MRRAMVIGLGLALLGGGLAAYRLRQGPAPVLEVLPAGEGASNLVPDLCALASSQGWLSGNYACLNGSGVGTSGMVDGGTAMNLVAVGSPLLTSQTILPSGPNGTNLPVIAFDGSATYFKTDGGEPMSGTFSVCYCGTMDKASTLPWISTGNTNIASSFLLYAANTGPSIASDVASDAGQGIVTSSLLTPAGAYSSTCATRKAVADGSDELRLYASGVSVGTPLTNRPSFGNRATQWVFGAEQPVYDFAYMVGKLRNGFITGSLLTPTQIAAYDSACVGSVTASRGEPITVTRATSEACTADDGTVTWLPPGRPCIVKGGIQPWPAATNALTNNNTLGGWTVEHANLADGGVLANPVVGVAGSCPFLAPDTSNTAIKVCFPAVSDSLRAGFSRVYGTYTGTAAAWMQSAYVRAADQLDGGTLYVHRASGPFIGACDAGSGWGRCTMPLTSAATDYMVLGPDTQAGFGEPATQPDLCVCLWEPQAELGSVATPLITTAASPVTRNADQVSVAFGGPTNMAKYSEDLDNAAFTATSLTVAANNATSFKGDLTAETLTAAAGSGAHDLADTSIVAVAGPAYSVSVFAKAGTVNFASLGFAAGGSSTFDLSTCAFVSDSSSTFAVGSITGPDSRGFCRLVVSTVAPLSFGYHADLRLGDTAAHARVSSAPWTAAGTETIIAGGWQVVKNGDATRPATFTGPGSYCHTGSAARLCDGTATNLILNSDSNPWTPSTANNADGGVVPAATVVVSDAGAEYTDPFGGTASVKVTYPAVDDALRGASAVVYSGFTGTAATYAQSFYAKTADGGTGTLYYGSYTAATPISSSCALDGGWNRCSLIRLATAASYNTQIGPNTSAVWAPQQPATQPALTVYLAMPDTTATPEAMPHIKTGATARWQHVSGFGDNEGCVSARICFSNPSPLVATPLSTGTSGSFIYEGGNNTQINLYDGTSAVGVTGLAPLDGRCGQGRAWWSTATGKMGVEFDGKPATPGNYDGSFGGFGTIYLGSQGGSANYLAGSVSDVKFGASRFGCQ